MLAIRHITDAPPSLPTISRLVIRRELDADVMAELQGRAASEMMGPRVSTRG